jgi:phage baseplate assembly protein V
MNTAEILRRLQNIIRLGTIAEVNNAARLLRVQSGDLLTNWLPWPAEVGNNFIRWRPLALGTQVVLACEGGEVEQAVIIGMLYTNSLNSPSTNHAVDMVRFNDGTTIQHDSSSSHTTVDSAGDVSVISPSLVTLDCPQTTVTGQLLVKGKLTYQAGMAGSGGGSSSATISGNVNITNGDVTADGVSLKGHTHQGDSGGSTGNAR